MTTPPDAAAPQGSPVATWNGSLAVVIPTLNEAGNIESLVAELFTLRADLAVFVMDDGSTDGSLERLDELSGRHGGLHVVRRSGQKGYGQSCIEGLRLALDSGAELLLQMDGDLSHEPRYVAAMLAAGGRADLVLGSRYVRGVSVVNWSLRRLLLSMAANRYVRVLTGLSVRDCTTGFRLWRRSLLERIDLASVQSEGYCFLVETLFKASRLNPRIDEVPIIFVERKEGESKLSSRVVLESALQPWRLLWLRILDALTSQTAGD